MGKGNLRHFCRPRMLYCEENVAQRCPLNQRYRSMRKGAAARELTREQSARFILSGSSLVSRAQYFLFEGNVYRKARTSSTRRRTPLLRWARSIYQTPNRPSAATSNFSTTPNPSRSIQTMLTTPERCLPTAGSGVYSVITTAI